MAQGRRSRLLLRIAVALAVVLAAVWLALPRLLGFAAERWLAIPGVAALRVDIGAIDARHASLHELAAIYTTPGGDRLRVALHGVDIDYALSARKVTALRAKKAELELTRAESGKAGPWPQLIRPQIPLESVQIDELQLRLKSGSAPSAAPEFAITGVFLASANAEHLQAEFHPAKTPAVLRLDVSEPADEKNLQVLAQWLPTGSGKAEGIQARLQIASTPSDQPVKLHVDTPLASLAQLAQIAGIALPELAPKGRLRVSADAELGDLSGALRKLSGDAELFGLSATLAPPSSPLGAKTALALAGKLHFAWQAGAGEIVLQPGFQWQANADDKAAPQLAGKLAQAFTLRRHDEQLISEGAFPLQVRAPALGEWRARLVTLQARVASSGLEQADAQIEFDGQRGEWRRDALKLATLKATGKLDLQWSPSDGLRSRFDLQAEPGRVSWMGETPITLLPSSWSLRGTANAGKTSDPMSALVIQGEAKSPQLTIQPATGAPLKTGAIRIALTPFLPFARGKSGGAGIDLQLAALALHYDNWPSADLDTRLRLAGDQLRANGSLHDPAGAILSFEATHKIAEGCGEATLSSTQALSQLDRRVQPRPPMLQPLSLSAGQLDARFALDWCVGGQRKAAAIDAHGTLELRDATVMWDKARVDALQTTLRVDSLQVPRGRLQITAARGELATGTALSDLKLDLALKEKQLDIRSLDLALLGGRIFSEPTSLPWPLTEQTLPLEIRHLDLARLLAMLKVQGLSGSGQLDGRLPLTWQRGSVEIDNGLLESTLAGTLKYDPTTALPDNPGLQALRDFRYDQLRTHLWYAADGSYRTQIRLEGHNPDFYSGYPIRFSLGVNGQLPGVFRAAAFSGDFNRHILEQLQAGKLQ